MGKLLTLTLACTMLAVVGFQPVLMGPPQEIKRGGSRRRSIDRRGGIATADDQDGASHGGQKRSGQDAQLVRTAPLLL
jgi:hypothetical protein